MSRTIATGANVGRTGGGTIKTALDDLQIANMADGGSVQTGDFIAVLRGGELRRASLSDVRLSFAEFFELTGATHLHFPGQSELIEAAGVVSGLSDLIGDRDAAQATAELRPTYVPSTAGLGGRPTIQYGVGAAEKALALPADFARNINTLSVLMVFRPSSLASNGALFNISQGDSNNDGRFSARLISNGAMSSRVSRLDADPETAYNTTLVPNISVDENVALFMQCDWENGEFLMQINGADARVQSSISGWDGATSDTDSVGCKIGSISAGLYLVGNIGLAAWWRDVRPTAEQIGWATEQAMLHYGGVSNF